MSFILDALRKSDQQRQRGAAPTLLTAQAAAVAPRRPAYWVQGLFAAALVGAGMLIGWLGPRQPEQPAAPVLATPETRAPAIPPALPALTRATKPPIQNPAVAAPSPGAPGPASASPATAAVAPGQAPAPEVAAGAGAQDAMALAELPVSIRQELPALQVLLHMYSPRPEKRFVTINNQTLQEGESAAPGVTLERITPDGMILSFKGYRFRRGVQQ
ncbi:MAG: hypothetical protein A3H33_02665 [Betaproteobacteria bacterium RIFCSPLOWO2_02_FULL_65_20]|nr:MAG: hypothetical protein A3H33_02665 [Betaproteobacteria bacterium RIFCSPLOWO2_02_FULL_65_20]